MQTYQDTQSIFAFGPIQTDYNTEVAASSSPKNYRQYAKEGFDHAKFTSENVTNEGYATGSPYGTKATKGKQDVTFGGTVRATFEELGRQAVDSFGDTGTPTTLATGVYKQKFQLLNPHKSSVLPCRPLVEKINEDAVSANNPVKNKYPSMTVSDITFMSGDKPDLQIQTNWRGSGKKITPSGIIFYGVGSHVKLDDELSEHFVKRTAGKLTLYPQAAKGGTAYQTDCAFRDMMIKITEGLNENIGYDGCGKYQDQNDPNSGSVRGQMPVGKQKAEVEYTLLLTPEVVANFNPEDKLIKGTEFSMEFIYLGTLIDATYNHKATFSVNKAIIKDVDFTMVDNVRAVKITTELLSVGDTMPVDLEIVSGIANFNNYVG